MLFTGRQRKKRLVVLYPRYQVPPAVLVLLISVYVPPVLIVGHSSTHSPVKATLEKSTELPRYIAGVVCT